MIVTISKTAEGFEVAAASTPRIYIYPTRTRALRKAGELLEMPETAALKPDHASDSATCPIDVYPSAPPQAADNTCREAAPSIGSPEWKQGFSERLQEIKKAKSAPDIQEV